MLVSGSLGSVLSSSTGLVHGFWQTSDPFCASVSLYKNANIPTYFRKSVVQWFKPLIQDVQILKPNMVSISADFEVTTLRDPRGQLPLGNAEWPKPRLPSRTYVVVSGEVVLLSG